MLYKYSTTSAKRRTSPLRSYAKLPKISETIRRLFSGDKRLTQLWSHIMNADNWPTYARLCHLTHQSSKGISDELKTATQRKDLENAVRALHRLGSIQLMMISGVPCLVKNLNTQLKTKCKKMHHENRSKTIVQTIDLTPKNTQKSQRHQSRSSTTDNQAYWPPRWDDVMLGETFCCSDECVSRILVLLTRLMACVWATPPLTQAGSHTHNNYSGIREQFSHIVQCWGRYGF